ncbi:MAG: hypothetical protein ACD_20C00428G0002 [uncultured bacterium]|nr:MAG: hypothetical protein ACD_20C00428G0002 [uncultured bacterium]
MSKDKIKENLANLRTVQTHIWTALLVTISGTLTLLQSFDKILSKILFTSGILFFLFLLNVYLNRNETINKLTQKMED